MWLEKVTLSLSLNVKLFPGWLLKTSIINIWLNQRSCSCCLSLNVTYRSVWRSSQAEYQCRFNTNPYSHLSIKGADMMSGITDRQEITDICNNWSWTTEIRHSAGKKTLKYHCNRLLEMSSSRFLEIWLTSNSCEIHAIKYWKKYYKYLTNTANYELFLCFKLLKICYYIVFKALNLWHAFSEILNNCICFITLWCTQEKFAFYKKAKNIHKFTY